MTRLAPTTNQPTNQRTDGLTTIQNENVPDGGLTHNYKMLLTKQQKCTELMYCVS